MTVDQAVPPFLPRPPRPVPGRNPVPRPAPEPRTVPCRTPHGRDRRRPVAPVRLRGHHGDRRHGRGGHTAQRHRTDGAAAGRYGRPAGAGGHRPPYASTVVAPRLPVTVRSRWPMPAGMTCTRRAYWVPRTSSPRAKTTGTERLSRSSSRPRRRWTVPGMVDDGLAQLLPPVDVVLGQHVAPFAGWLRGSAGRSRVRRGGLHQGDGVRAGWPCLPAGDHRRPVVLAASIVLRLQTVVAREVEPGEPAVLTVGSLRGHQGQHHRRPRGAGAQHPHLQQGVRSAILAAIQRIVTAECAASGSPRDPEFEFYEHAPLTDNDPGVTAKLIDTFTGVFGDRVVVPPRVLGSEDFSDIARGVSAPYSYWLFGGTDPEVFAKAAAADRLRAISQQPLAAFRSGHPADPRHRHHRPGGGRAELAGWLARRSPSASSGVRCSVISVSASASRGGCARRRPWRPIGRAVVAASTRGAVWRARKVGQHAHRAGVEAPR